MMWNKKRREQRQRGSTSLLKAERSTTKLDSARITGPLVPTPQIFTQKATPINLCDEQLLRRQPGPPVPTPQILTRNAVSFDFESDRLCPDCNRSLFFRCEGKHAGKLNVASVGKCIECDNELSFYCDHCMFYYDLDCDSYGRHLVKFGTDSETSN